MIDLPNALKGQVFSFLNVQDSDSLASVCSDFQDGDALFNFFRELKEKECVTSEDIAKCFKLLDAKKVVDISNEPLFTFFNRRECRQKALQIFFSRCSDQLKHIKCDGNVYIGNVGFYSFFSDGPKFSNLYFPKDCLKFRESLLSIRLQSVEGQDLCHDCHYGAFARAFPRIQQVEKTVLNSVAYLSFDSPKHRDYATPYTNRPNAAEPPLPSIIVTIDLARYRRERFTYFERFKHFVAYSLSNYFKRS